MAFEPSLAQTLNPQPAPSRHPASTSVPALVPSSGTMTEPNGRSVSGETAVPFLIFKDQEGGEAALGRNPGHYPRL